MMRARFRYWKGWKRFGNVRACILVRLVLKVSITWYGRSSIIVSMRHSQVIVTGFK
ncbi:hypothetical protein D3C75_710870 [compost metagenome]